MSEVDCSVLLILCFQEIDSISIPSPVYYFFPTYGFTNFCSLVNDTNNHSKVCLEQIFILHGVLSVQKWWEAWFVCSEQRSQGWYSSIRISVWGPAYHHFCQDLLFTQKSERFHLSMFSLSGSWIGAVTSQTTSFLNIHIWRWQLDSLHKSTWSSLITRLKSTPWHHWCFLTLIFCSCDSSQL